MKRIGKTSSSTSLIFSLLLLGVLFSCSTVPHTLQAQEGRTRQPLSENRPTLPSTELDPQKLDREFIRRHSLREDERASGVPQVRMIYLVPSDRPISAAYRAAIADAILHLRDFYQREMGSGYTFTLHDPIVEVYQTNHTASWYSTNPRDPNNSAGWFWENALADGFAYTGGGFNDPNNRWIFYIDADPACNQYIGGTSGVALLAANDLRGLTRQQNIPPCSGQQPDNGGVYRWIGGLGHELGHAFNLPHPPGCDQGACQGGQTAANSLMYFGYALYPNTYLLPADKTTLLNSGFFSVQDLSPPTRFDFDNDNKADASVWRPSTGVWHVLPSSTGNSFSTQWGTNGDKLVPGDYDGDSKTDIAVWRPSNGTWNIIHSSDNTMHYHYFGSNGDQPVQADYDGDNETDIAVWRPSDGVWYIIRSATGTLWTPAWGLSSDVPVPGDYNGDKRTDLTVWRPSTGQWFIYDNYTGNFSAPQFGSVGDKLVPNDYDGDKKTDIAVWRPSDSTWYIQRSSNGTVQYHPFGLSTDVVAPGDYDGDGKTDVAVWRSSDTYFYIWRSSTNSLQTIFWGANGDIPVASSPVP